MSRVYYQNEFKKDERKIILSEEVAIRLLGLLNLCGYKTGINKSNLNEGYEYGGWLIGKINNKGDIEFTLTNKSNNFTIRDGCFKYDEDKDAFDEILTYLFKEDYDCVAQFHTHPYAKNEASRFFSTPDINLYKEILSSKNISNILNKEIMSFGCLLTCADDQKPEENEKDDISFVSYNDVTNEMHYFPNIYIKTRDNILIPLEHIKTKLYLDENGKPYRYSKITDDIKITKEIEIERTNFSIETDESIIKPQKH